MSARRQHRDPVQDSVLKFQMSEWNFDRFREIAHRALAEASASTAEADLHSTDYELFNNILEGRTLTVGLCNCCLDDRERQFRGILWKLRHAFAQEDEFRRPGAIEEILRALERSAQAQKPMVLCEFHGYSERKGLNPCEVCPCELPERVWDRNLGRPTGRRRRYCSNSCRQRAHRLRETVGCGICG